MNPVENYKDYAKMDDRGRAAYRDRLENSIGLNRSLAGDLKEMVSSAWGETDLRRVQALANAAAFEAEAAAGEAFLREIKFQEMDPALRERVERETINTISESESE